jgi:hypothetical protein
MAIKVSHITYGFLMLMSGFCFWLFARIALAELAAKLAALKKPGEPVQPGLESLPQVGDLAEKFSKSGLASSALACSVLFALLAASIGIAIDDLKIFTLFSTSK